MTFWITFDETQYWFVIITLSIMLVTVVVGTTYAIIKQVKEEKELEKS